MQPSVSAFDESILHALPISVEVGKIVSLQSCISFSTDEKLESRDRIFSADIGVRGEMAYKQTTSHSVGKNILEQKREILAEVFGYHDFRPGQEQVIDSLLAGRHALAVMPTGAGKSLCYQVPALVKGGLTIVVSPLIALMQDQVNALCLNGVAADCINSAKSRADNVAAWRRVARGETRLLYMAPRATDDGANVGRLEATADLAFCD